MYLIFTRRGVDIDAYPLIKAHLEKFKKRLEPKPKDYPANKIWAGRKAGIYQWYEIQDTVAYYEQFEEHKIMYAHFQSEPLFSYDTSNVFCNNKAYAIPNGGYFLLGYLNSRIFWFIFTSMTTMMRGGYYEATTQNIERIPIPSATPEQQTIANLAEQCQTHAKTRYDLEQKVQNRFIENFRPKNNHEPLNTKLSQWWKLATVTELASEARKAFKLKKTETLKVDLSNPSKQDEWESYLKENTRAWQDTSNTINDLEKQINQAVYALFNLTNEEISLIERNI